MPRIPVFEGEIDGSQELVDALVPILREVQSGRTSMEERQAAGYTIDVGGRGVAYGVIRLRLGEMVYKITPSMAPNLLAILAPGTPAPAPEGPSTAELPLAAAQMVTHAFPVQHPLPPPVHHAARVETPPPAPVAPAVPTVNELIARVADLAAGTDAVVTDAEMRKVAEWVKECREHGAGALAEEALTQLLQSPKTPALLKARLVQHLAHAALPRLSSALATAYNDPRIQDLLRDRRVQSVLRRLQERGRQ